MDELADRRQLALQYYIRLPPRHTSFQWPSLASLLSIQDHLADDLCLDSDLEDGVHCKRTFLKHLLSLLQEAIDRESDDAEVEINGKLLEVYAHLMALGTSTSSSQKVRYYYPGTESQLGDCREPKIFEGWNCITVEEEIYDISRGTTGLKTWEASLRLAAHLVAQPDNIARKDMVILELGSGSGFLGAVVARLASTAQIHLTDRDGIVLDHLRRTIEQNVVDSQSITVAPLDWLEVEDGGTDASSVYLASLRPHLVLAADVVYHPDIMDPLCRVLRSALSWSRDSYALLAYPIRNEETHSLFLQSIDRNGLTTTRHPLYSPQVDLLTGKLSSIGLSLFPSTHEETRDGPMMLHHVKIKQDFSPSSHPR